MCLVLPQLSLVNSVFLCPWEATGPVRQVTMWRTRQGQGGAWVEEPSDNRKQLQQAPGR